MAATKTKPRVEVYERAIQNPFGEPSEAIQLKDKSRVCHWFNADIQNDHIWRKKRRGWLPVRPEDLVDIEQIGGVQVDAAGGITRGERGKEVLMSMPRDVYHEIQMAKTKLNLKNVGNPAGMQREVVEAAGHTLGDAVASFGEKAGPSGRVVDTRERIAVVDEE